MNESNGYLGSHRVEDKVGIQTRLPALKANSLISGWYWKWRLSKV